MTSRCTLSTTPPGSTDTGKMGKTLRLLAQHTLDPIWGMALLPTCSLLGREMQVGGNLLRHSGAFRHATSEPAMSEALAEAVWQNLNSPEFQDAAAGFPRWPQSCHPPTQEVDPQRWLVTAFQYPLPSCGRATRNVHHRAC